MKRASSAIEPSRRLVGVEPRMGPMRLADGGIGPVIRPAPAGRAAPLLAMGQGVFMNQAVDHVASPRDQRFAALGGVLARAVAAGELEVTYALRILRHQLRLMNVNSAMKAPMRSLGAQAVIDRYSAEGRVVPKNGSPDALHSDHVNALRAVDLERLQTASAWLVELPRLKEVACVTAAENYALEKFEQDGADGWAKYTAAEIKLSSIPHNA